MLIKSNQVTGISEFYDIRHPIAILLLMEWGIHNSICMFLN